MKYITLFDTTAEFEAAQSTLDKPNVSLVEATQNISYLPYVAPETRVIIKYNVTDTEADTPLYFADYPELITEMEIDGVKQNNVVTSYRFDTTGEHIQLKLHYHMIKTQYIHGHLHIQIVLQKS